MHHSELMQNVAYELHL